MSGATLMNVLKYPVKLPSDGILSVRRRQLLALARRGFAGAYPLGTGTVRKVWVFRLSELAAAIERHVKNAIRSGQAVPAEETFPWLISADR
jgi:hypothetical protein